ARLHCLPRRGRRAGARRELDDLGAPASGQVDVEAIDAAPVRGEADAHARARRHVVRRDPDPAERPALVAAGGARDLPRRRLPPAAATCTAGTTAATTAGTTAGTAAGTPGTPRRSRSAAPAGGVVRGRIVLAAGGEEHEGGEQPGHDGLHGVPPRSVGDRSCHTTASMRAATASGSGGQGSHSTSGIARNQVSCRLAYRRWASFVRAIASARSIRPSASARASR